jgi:hypothetical protein
MSLIVNLQVTETSNHLKQIHNIVITNVSFVEPMRNGQTPYTAAVDGEMQPDFIFHDRDDGALHLLGIVLARHRNRLFYEKAKQDVTGT